jgi:CyaY protein
MKQTATLGMRGPRCHDAAPEVKTPGAEAPMDEKEFRDRAHAIYKAVLARLDLEDPDDIEGEMSAGVVRIRSRGGATYVLNHQTPLAEIWYAAGDRAWHFRFDPAIQAWVDPRNGDELGATLGRTVSTASGRDVSFTLPNG